MFDFLRTEKSPKKATKRLYYINEIPSGFKMLDPIGSTKLSLEAVKKIHVKLGDEKIANSGRLQNERILRTIEFIIEQSNEIEKSVANKTTLKILINDDEFDFIMKTIKSIEDKIYYALYSRNDTIKLEINSQSIPFLQGFADILLIIKLSLPYFERFTEIKTRISNYRDIVIETLEKSEKQQEDNSYHDAEDMQKTNNDFKK